MLGNLKKIKGFEKQLDAWTEKYVEVYLADDAKKELKEIITNMIVGNLLG